MKALKNQVRNYPWNEIKNQAHKKIKDQTWEKIMIQIKGQDWYLIHNPIKSYIGAKIIENIKTGNHIYIATLGINQICKNILPQPIGRKLLEVWLYNRIDKLRNDSLLPDNCKSFAENIIKTTYKKITKGYYR